MHEQSLKLGVNIDHVATVREARGTPYPDLVAAAGAAEAGGADFITIHLREDRRHIQDADVEQLQAAVSTHLNLELAATTEMVHIAGRVKPHACCIVPERREELTTEGGLDVLGMGDTLRASCERLLAAGIEVSLFVDPDARQIEAAAGLGVPAIELHTGAYANRPVAEADTELDLIRQAAQLGLEQGLKVNAGHGLHVENVAPIAAIAGIAELNIGHAIVARALFIGLQQAVEEMRSAMDHAQR